MENKKKEPFIDKDLRPDLDIDLNKKIGDLTVRELSTILGFDLTEAGQEAAGDAASVQSAAIIKPVKDFKDARKDLPDGKRLKDSKDRTGDKPIIKEVKDLAEFNALTGPSKMKEDFYEKGISEGFTPGADTKLLEELIRKISGLEKEIKDLKEKQK